MISGETEQQNGFENSTKRVQAQITPKDPRSQLNLDLLSKSKLLSECDNSLEFILVSFCRAFEFQNGRQAFEFVSGGGNSKYSQCFQDMQNFSKINQFLSLLFTNLKSMIRILESENDHQQYHGNQYSHSQNSSQQRIMNLLSMGLSRSVDHRIVWQTCILLSGIFQNVNGIQINYGFQTQMIRWALNQNDLGEFMGPNKVSSSQQYDFIQSCLIARQRHSELNNVIIDLLYEVANMGRSKRKMDRQNDNSQLVELFSIILPKYFDDSTIHEYFELMHDLLESHHFQIEKERIDKQHLLFKIIDKCLFHLSIINEVQDPRNPQQPEDIEKLQKSVNTRQSCMSLLCSIWSNNQQIFRQTINKFLSNFVQSKLQKIIPSTALDLFKNNMDLMFDYNEYQMQTKVGKIVLLLLKRNLKDQNKLIKITTFSQLFRLLDQFTQREENDLQSVVFKLLVLQLSEQFQKQSVKDCIDVREIVSHYLASYIEKNEKANIGFLVDTIREYGKQYLQKYFASGNEAVSYTNQFPLFNMSDYYLMTKIIYHPRTNSLVANSLLDFFKCIVLSDKFFDYSTLNFVLKYIVKLSVQFVRDLFQNFKSLFQSCCFMLTKLDIQILRLQNQIKKEVKYNKKTTNVTSGGQSNDGEQLNSLCDILKYARISKTEVLPAHSQLSNLVLKRHIIFNLALLMVSKSSSRPGSKPQAATSPSGANPGGAALHTREGLRLFAIDFLGKHLAKPNTSKSLDLLYKEVRSAESAQGRLGSSGSRDGAHGTGQLGQQKKNAAGLAERAGAGGLVVAGEQGKFGRLQIADGHMQTMQAKPSLHKYARNRDGSGDAANGLYQGQLGLPRRDNIECKSAREGKDEAESANGTCIETINFVGRNIFDMNYDLEDQSSQTTLRTEIYTSEDEQEMMNYYGYINGQQRPGKSKTFRSAKQSPPPKQPQVSEQKQIDSFNQKQNTAAIHASEQKSSMHVQFNQKQRIPSIKPFRVVADSPLEPTENNATMKYSEAVQSTQYGLKRSNSSQFHQSIKIMDEKHVLVRPPKIPQAFGAGDNESRPAILQRQNEAFARKRRFKNKKNKSALRRQSSHAVAKQENGEANLEEQRQLPPKGHRTDREMFQNRLTQYKRNALGPLSTRMSESNISIVNQPAEEIEGVIMMAVSNNEPGGASARRDKENTKRDNNGGPQQRTEGTGRGFESGLFSSEKRGDSNTSKDNDKKSGKKEVLRVDPNSNYMLKAKYVTNDLIPEESNEMSSKQVLQEQLPIYSQFVLPKPKKPLVVKSGSNAISAVSQRKLKEQLREKKAQEDYSNMIHPTSDPNVMIISSKRGIGNTSRRSFNNSVVEQPQNENKAANIKQEEPRSKQQTEAEKPQAVQPIKVQTDEGKERQADSKPTSKIKDESGGNTAKVPDAIHKNNPKEIEIESKKPIQKIDLPKDPNSGLAKKQIKGQQNAAGGETPKAISQPQLGEPQTKRSIQNSKPDILVGKGKKSWRGSQYGDSHKSNQGSIKGGSIKQLSIDDNNKESIVVKPQEIQQINKDIRFQMSYEMAKKSERDRLSNKEQKQTQNEASQKLKEAEEQQKIQKPAKVLEPTQADKSESKRIESTKRQLSEKSKPNEKSKSRIITVDGNNLQSQLDSLNDRGDSSDRGLTPQEAANLDIIGISPIGNNNDARFESQDQLKTDILNCDIQVPNPIQAEAKDKVEQTPVKANQPPPKQKEPASDAKQESNAAAAKPSAEPPNTPARVKEQLRKIFHHDEEAEKEKNATIYLKQYENIIAKSQYDEEKSFRFQDTQKEKKDQQLLINAIEDSGTNISNTKQRASKVVESRTPQQNRKGNLDIVKKEKVDADQSASQVNIPAVDSPHSESRSVSKSPSLYHPQQPMQFNKPSLMLQTPLNFDPRVTGQSTSPIHLPYSPYTPQEGQVHQPSSALLQQTPNSAPGPTQHFNGQVTPTNPQRPHLALQQPGTGLQTPHTQPQMNQSQPHSQANGQQQTAAGYASQGQPYGALKQGSQAAGASQFNYHDFMAQMEYLQQVQNDLMVKLKHLEHIKQMPNAQSQMLQQQMMPPQSQDAQGHLVQNMKLVSMPNTTMMGPHPSLESFPNRSQSPHVSLTASQQPAISLSHAGQYQSRQVPNIQPNTQNATQDLIVKPVNTRSRALDHSPTQKSDYNVNNNLSKSYMGPLRMATADEARTTQNFNSNTGQSQNNVNNNAKEQQTQIRRRQQQSALSTRSIVSSMTQQNRFQNTVAPAALSQYFDHQKRKKKRKVLKEFKETLKIMNPSADQLETMSQKVSQRIQNLRKKKEEKDRLNASQLGSVRDDRSMKRRLSNLSHISNNNISNDLLQQFNAPRTSHLNRQQPQQLGNLPSLPEQQMLPIGGVSQHLQHAQQLPNINQPMQQAPYAQFRHTPLSQQYAHHSTSPYHMYGQQLPHLVGNATPQHGAQTPNSSGLQLMGMHQSQIQAEQANRQNHSISAGQLPNLPGNGGNSMLQQQQSVSQIMQSQQNQSSFLQIQQQPQPPMANSQMAGAGGNFNNFQMHHSPQPYSSGLSAYGQQIMNQMGQHGHMQQSNPPSQKQQQPASQMYQLFPAQQAYQQPSNSNPSTLPMLPQQYLGGDSQQLGSQQQPVTPHNSQPNAVSNAYFQFNQGTAFNAASNMPQ